MIPRKKINELSEKIKQDGRYSYSLKKILEYINPNEQELTENTFIEKFVKLIRENGWNRAKSYGFLSSIWTYCDEQDILTDQLHDIFEAISTMLTGYCAPQYVIFSLGDPEDLLELRDHALSTNWYSEE